MSDAPKIQMAGGEWKTQSELIAEAYQRYTDDLEQIEVDYEAAQSQTRLSFDLARSDIVRMFASEKN